MFIDYINRIAPDYVRVKVTPMHGGEGYVCPIDLPAYKAAEKAMRMLSGRNLWLFVGGEHSYYRSFRESFRSKIYSYGFRSGVGCDAFTE